MENVNQIESGRVKQLYVYINTETNEGELSVFPLGSQEPNKNSKFAFKFDFGPGTEFKDRSEALVEARKRLEKEGVINSKEIIDGVI